MARHAAELSAPVAAQGLISIIISCCTIVSSLLTARLAHRMGTGRPAALSMALTTGAVLGFSATNAFWQLRLIAIPYGLGAGAIDSALNNYVAPHYNARHMSWLHCCWGIGASMGPLVMGWALADPLSWHCGYLAIGTMQAVITAALFPSLPLWKSTGGIAGNGGAAVKPADRQTVSQATVLGDSGASLAATQPKALSERPLTNRELLRLPGAHAAIGSFGTYCVLEGSIGLWIASYLTMARGLNASTAASIVSQFYLGITLGRLISGFVAQWLTSENQICLGQALIAGGLIGLVTLNGAVAAGVCALVAELGCAPIYPSIVALTPKRFGERASQGLVSLQIACAYTGSMLFPPVFGLVTGSGGAALIPLVAIALLGAHFILAERAVRKTKPNLDNAARSAATSLKLATPRFPTPRAPRRAAPRMPRR